MAEIKITKDNFNDSVAGASGPILLDFWATWCGPCKMIAPVLQELDAKYEQLTIGKINVDEETELAAHFRIYSIPTLVLIKDSKILDMTAGFMPLEKLEAWMQAAGAI